jgi:acyl carrier protein
MPAYNHEIEAMLHTRHDVEVAMVVDYGPDKPILAMVKPHIYCSGPVLRDLCAAMAGDAAPRVTVVLVPEIPRMASGYPDASQTLAESRYIYRYEPPATLTEQLLISMWNEVLGRKWTGALDDFLDLGGDSVRAVQVISRIDGELGVDVDIAQFFDFPSVRALAALVDAAR